MHNSAAGLPRAGASTAIGCVEQAGVNSALRARGADGAEPGIPGLADGWQRLTGVLSCELRRGAARATCPLCSLDSSPPRRSRSDVGVSQFLLHAASPRRFARAEETSEAWRGVVVQFVGSLVAGVWLVLRSPLLLAVGRCSGSR